VICCVDLFFMCWRFVLLMIDVFDFEITVENVVMFGTFSEGIDLGVANLRLEGSKRSWKRFPGLFYKLKVPQATFLLFKNGKFVCTGVKTKTKGEEAIINFFYQLTFFSKTYKLHSK